MKEIPFNLNEGVKVKLNELGISILKQRRDELNQILQSRGFKGFGEYQPVVDEDGYTSFQMWGLIETYGPYIGMGKEAPFDLNIKILTEG